LYRVFRPGGGEAAGSGKRVKAKQRFSLQFCENIFKKENSFFVAVFLSALSH
jgi:hypothetical protein